jgi:hypothetical protein
MCSAARLIIDQESPGEGEGPEAIPLTGSRGDLFSPHIDRGNDGARAAITERRLLVKAMGRRHVNLTI